MPIKEGISSDSCTPFFGRYLIKATLDQNAWFDQQTKDRVITEQQQTFSSKER